MGQSYNRETLSQNKTKSNTKQSTFPYLEEKKIHSFPLSRAWLPHSAIQATGKAEAGRLQIQGWELSLTVSNMLEVLGLSLSSTKREDAKPRSDSRMRDSTAGA